MTRRHAMLATAAAAVILLVGGAAAMFVLKGGDHRFAACEGSMVAGGSDLIGGPFTLTRHDEVKVSETDVIDGLTLIYFGYTYCPDVCPVDVVRNADAIDLLDERGIEVKPVMITVDPARDTPEVLADYVFYMHPRMVGLTGTEEEVEVAKTAYRAYGARAEGGDDDYYTVDHSTMSYLMAPEEGLLTFFRRDEDAAELADRIACFAEAI